MKVFLIGSHMGRTCVRMRNDQKDPEEWGKEIV